MDEPTSACPNCGTPRGPYDRFCTGCAADLGAPGAPIGLIGTLGEMNVAGPSSRQGRVQPAAAPRSVAGSVVGWVVPGSRSRPLSVGAPVPVMARGGQLSGIGGYPSASSSAGAYRLWRTLGIANRIIAVLWFVFLLATVATYLSGRSEASSLVGFIAVIGVFALPSVFLWMSAPRLMRGEPSWLRSVVLLEIMVIVVFTFGLALVPLLFIFLAVGTEP